MGSKDVLWPIGKYDWLIDSICERAAANPETIFWSWDIVQDLTPDMDKRQRFNMYYNNIFITPRYKKRLHKLDNVVADSLYTTIVEKYWDSFLLPLYRSQKRTDWKATMDILEEKFPEMVRYYKYDREAIGKSLSARYRYMNSRENYRTVKNSKYFQDIMLKVIDEINACPHRHSITSLSETFGVTKTTLRNFFKYDVYGKSLAHKIWYSPNYGRTKAVEMYKEYLKYKEEGRDPIELFYEYGYSRAQGFRAIAAAKTFVSKNLFNVAAK